MDNGGIYGIIIAFMISLQVGHYYQLIVIIRQRLTFLANRFGIGT